MTNRFIGCENHASATAKLEVVKSGTTKTIYYFGDNMDAIAKYYSLEGYSDIALALFFKDEDNFRWISLEIGDEN